MRSSDQHQSFNRLLSREHAFTYALAALKVEIKLLRLRTAYKANFNPNQPRVPAGNPDGGQWTDTGVGRRRERIRGLRQEARDRERINRIRLAQASGQKFPVMVVRNNRGQLRPATPAQATMLTVTQVNVNQALAAARRIKPDWRPTRSFFRQSVEGDIARNNLIAREAWSFVQRNSPRRSRFSPLGNNPPVQPFPSNQVLQNTFLITRTQQFFSTYRQITGMPVVPSGIAKDKKDGTVALSNINGQIFSGVNSTSPAFTSTDNAAAKSLRKTLIEKYPDVMKTTNIGMRPNDALFHAEATLLLRATKAFGGSLSGKSFVIRTDRDLCQSCVKVLPKIARELGNPTIRFMSSDGSTWTLRDGILMPGLSK